MAGFPYKQVLLIRGWATSGVGRGMADHLIEAGIKVTAVGRWKERLDEFVQKHTQNKAQRLVFNVGDIGKAPQLDAKWVHSTTPAIELLNNHRNSAMEQYPDTDCVSRYLPFTDGA